MITFSGVSVDLIARHVDPHMSEGEHGHVWTVTAFYPFADHVDLRSHRAALAEVLRDLQGVVLPPELWSGEALIRRVLVLANCIGARVTRPEGYEAWAWL